MKTQPPHGTRARYNLGCRCLPCVYACSDYRREYNRTGGVRRVAAAPVRAHLDELAAHGVELKAVAKMAGVATTTVYGINGGRQARILATTRDKLLAVDYPDYSRNARVPGTEARKLVGEMNAAGVMSTEIAAALGYRADHLNFCGRKTVSKRTMQRLRLVALMFQRAGRLSGEVLL